MVIGLLVGLILGARWAKVSRAFADLRSARTNLTKAVNARRSAVLRFAVAVLFAVALALVYLIGIGAIPPQDPYQQ